MKEKEDMTKENGKEQNQKGSSGSSKELFSARSVSLERLQTFPGSRHKMKRLGRGRSSGHGGTSTKGHKGQRARSGFGLLRGFEGGQMPLVRLLPKFGFTNARFKKKCDIINLSVLNRFDSEVDPSILYSAGLVRKKAFVKILAQGELTKPLTVRAHNFSKKAIELIEKAGGKVEKLVSVVDNNRATSSSASESATDIQIDKSDTSDDTKLASESATDIQIDKSGTSDDTDNKTSNGNINQ